MMGTSHAISGAAAWTALTATQPWGAGLLLELSGWRLGAGALLAAGAALLPDLDHPSATAARALPPITQHAARLVSSISGGHRHGTHSIIGLAVAVSTCWAIGHIEIAGPTGPLAVGPAAVALILAALAVTALKLARTRLVAWALALVFAVGVALLAPADPTWLAISVGTGYLAHIVGDALTTGGVPITWPLVARPSRLLVRFTPLTRMWKPNGYFALPVLGDTGSAREGVVASLMGVYATAALAITVASSSIRL